MGRRRKQEPEDFDGDEELADEVESEVSEATADTEETEETEEG